jgi:ubiquinone biosynthesis protein UbiJ
MLSPSYDAAWRNTAAAVSDAVVQELTLWLNHVIASEPMAAERLQAHAGRHVRVSLGEGSRRPLALNFAVTAAGLLETLPGPGPCAACLTVRPGRPLRDVALSLINGERVPWIVEGDAAMAADVDWLVRNLRWDVHDDLASLVGPVVARELARSGASVSDVARGAARLLAALVPEGRNPPAGR